MCDIVTVASISCTILQSGALFIVIRVTLCSIVQYLSRGVHQVHAHYDRSNFPLEWRRLDFNAMAKFRKGLPTVENYASDSEYEEYFDPPNDEDRKKRKRQIKPPIACVADALNLLYIASAN